jgi:hypothetical protein
MASKRIRLIRFVVAGFSSRIWHRKTINSALLDSSRSLPICGRIIFMRTLLSVEVMALVAVSKRFEGFVNCENYQSVGSCENYHSLRGMTQQTVLLISAELDRA